MSVTHPQGFSGGRPPAVSFSHALLFTKTWKNVCVSVQCNTILHCLQVFFKAG